MEDVLEDLTLSELDARGETYVRKHLTEVNALSSALLDAFRASRGKTSTLVPVGLSRERLYEFERGGLLAANLDFS